MVLTDTVQLSMWWTAFCLRIRGYVTGGYHVSRIRTWLLNLWKPQPPERIDRGRPKGTNKSAQRQKRFDAELTELVRPPNLFKRVTGRRSLAKHCRLLLLGLQASARIQSRDIPSFTLSSDWCIRQRLRRYKSKGLLSTTNLRQEDLSRLRQVLTD
jgi:hypothetical protein